MATIHELKGRLASVKTVGKMTAAMQMVSSAKLKRAIRANEQFIPYKKMLVSIFRDLLMSDYVFESPYLQEQGNEKVTFVVFSSNKGLCGAFNIHIIDALKEQIRLYKSSQLRIITIGEKVKKAVESIPFHGESEDWSYLIEHPVYSQMKKLVNHLSDLYLKNKTNKILLIYFKYKTSLVHDLTIEQFLPISINLSPKHSTSFIHLYLLEPNAQGVFDQLMPKVLRSRMYAAMLHSFSSEQSARTVAMQQATDNADELSKDLSLKMNRQRQQLITTEIIELTASANAQSTN